VVVEVSAEEGEAVEAVVAEEGAAVAVEEEQARPARVPAAEAPVRGRAQPRRKSRRT
jgi:hypothetical protein